LPDKVDCTYNFKDNDEKEVEKFVGIELYNTPDFEGIGGIYKNSYKDFIVKEITNSGKTLEIKEDYSNQAFSRENKDRYTTFNLVKVNKEPFEAIRELSKSLNVPYNTINYCGLKDKRSISVQQVSIKGNYTQKLKKLKIRDYFFRNIYPTRHPIKLGGHWGNNFTIVIRNIEPKENLEDNIENINNYIATNGFPNYYGLQRFGTFRPNSHLIGRYLLEGNYERAYNEFVTTTYSTEDNKLQIIRNNLKEDEDLQKAYETLPKSLNYERLMIKHLIDHPGDYKGSFSILSNDLIKLLISAFQSFLFNKMISLRIREGYSLLKGDTISILDDVNGHITQAKYIYGGRYDKYLEEAIELNRAVIVAPLVGYETNLADFPLMKLYFDKIIKEEGVDPSIFNTELISNTDFKGAFRSIYVKPIALKILHLKDDELFPEKMRLKFEFSVQKGSYATMLLRELIK